MRIKTKYFGTLEGDELSLSRLADVIEDAAAYNLEKHYIKVHGDLMTEVNMIRKIIDGKKSCRSISAASQEKRPKRVKKTAGSTKQTGIYKESDKK